MRCTRICIFNRASAQNRLPIDIHCIKPKSKQQHMGNRRNQQDIQEFENSIDLTPAREATKQELQTYISAQKILREITIENAFNQNNEKHFLFIAAFDGTGNERANRDKNYTNVALLEELISEKNSNNSQIASIYFPGVATGDIPLSKRLYESITGDGSIQRAEKAFLELEQRTRIWKKQHSDCQIHIITLGFSRGTGSQRHFANMLDTHTLQDETGATLIAKEQLHQDLMLLFDSVITGQEDALQVGIAKSVKKAVHIIAGNENRIKFDLASIIDPYNLTDKDVYEIELPGAHIDIGGQYAYDDPEQENGLSLRVLNLARELLVNFGVPIETIAPRFNIEQAGIDIQDSGKFGLHNIEFGLREIWHPGNLARRSQAVTKSNEPIFYTRQDAKVMRYDPEKNISKPSKHKNEAQTTS